eukprot:1181657-Pleurochrysis_carterae.AAC.2
MLLLMVGRLVERDVSEAMFELESEAKTRAMRKLKSGGYAVCAPEFQVFPSLDPPAMCVCSECWHRRCAKDCKSGVILGEQSSEVYFCEEAPRAHCGKEIMLEPVSALRARMSGSSQIGAWSRCRSMGEESAPRSAGCSRTNSAPAV